MSAAMMGARVGGPTYLSGSSLGIAGAASALGVAASVDRDAGEQPPNTIADHATIDGKNFTCTPWKEEAGAGRIAAYPGGCYANKTTSDHESNPALYREDRDPSPVGSG